MDSADDFSLAVEDRPSLGIDHTQPRKRIRLIACPDQDARFTSLSIQNRVLFEVLAQFPEMMFQILFALDIQNKENACWHLQSYWRLVVRDGCTLERSNAISDYAQFGQ